MPRHLEKLNEVTWLNAKDSLSHALNHFFELASAPKNKRHHYKWIIISVHHAASCLVSLWLREADNNHPLFVGPNGKESYPHLEEAIKALQKHSGSEHLTEAESHLLELLRRLNDIRNKFMHRLPPNEIDKAVVAHAAASMVGLLHAVSRRSGQTFYGLFEEFPDIRRYITEAIHYSRVEEYCSFVEKLLKDQGHARELPRCPSCGTQAVIGNQCEACFADVTEVECPECHGEFYIQRSYPFEQECPECGYGYRA
jgi:hypothetical protein